VLVTLATPATSPASGAASAVAPVTAVSRTVVYPVVGVLAGSPRWLVYEYAASENSRTIRVRSKAGHTRTLPLDPIAGQNNLDPLAFSIAGDTLTAEMDSDSANNRTILLWWNLKTGRHGHRRSPTASYSYSGATPGGFLLWHGRTVEKLSISGAATTLATVGKYDTVYDGLDGFVDNHYAKKTTVRYESWSHPGRLRVIQRLPGRFGCGDSDAQAVGCAGDTITPDDLYGASNRIGIVSVDGKHAVTTNACANGTKPGGFGGSPNDYLDFGAVAVGHFIVFRGCKAFQILSDTGKATAVHTILNGSGESPRAAYGRLIFVRGTGQGIFALNPASGKISTILTVGQHLSGASRASATTR
jgi:hypothetical protein